MLGLHLVLVTLHMWFTVRVDSHGVPSPTHVSKSQHGGKVPTFEPRETIKTRSIISKSDFNSFMQIYSQDLC